MAEIWKGQCMAVHGCAWQRQGLDAAANGYNLEQIRQRIKTTDFQETKDKESVRKFRSKGNRPPLPGDSAK